MTYNPEAALTLLQSDYNTDFQPGVAIEKAPVNPNTAAAMVAPVTTTGAFTLKVYTSTVTAGKEVTVQLKGTGVANKGLEVGKKHTVTLQFTAENKNIQVLSTSIEVWGDGYSGNPGLITP